MTIGHDPSGDDDPPMNDQLKGSPVVRRLIRDVAPDLKKLPPGSVASQIPDEHHHRFFGAVSADNQLRYPPTGKETKLTLLGRIGPRIIAIEVMTPTKRERQSNGDRMFCSDAQRAAFDLFAIEFDPPKSDPFTVEDELLYLIPLEQKVRPRLEPSNVASQSFAPVGEEKGNSAPIPPAAPKGEGTPVDMTDEDKAIALAMKDHGSSVADIAAKLGVNRQTPYRWPKFIAVYKGLKSLHTGNAPRHGSKDRDGNLEAEDDSK